LSGLCLALIAFLFQWELEQFRAWGSMFAGFSQSESIAKAARDTFSGEKPCSRCHQLTRERASSTSETALNAPTTPRPTLFVFETAALPARSASFNPKFTDRHVQRRNEISPPPVPPPRFLSC